MEEIYGYCRVSTPQQNIERQRRNILEKFPSAHIVEEYYTGTKTLGRSKWNKLYALVCQEVEAGKKVILVFDSASRMSRNADEGYELYEHLFYMGVKLVFLKEPHINTDVYRNATKIQVEMTGTNADILLKAVNEYLLAVAKEQIATVYKGNIIKNLIMDCQSYTKYRPNETTGGIFVSWRRKEELPTGA